MGKLPDLLRVVLARLEDQPASLPDLHLLRQVREAEQDRPGAADAARRLYAADPQSVSPFEVAMACQAADEYDRAAEFIEKTPPHEWPADAAASVVACYRALGRMEKLEEFAAELGVSSLDPALRTYREGQLLLEAGDAARAIPLLEQAGELPNVPWERTRARAYAAVGRTDDAVAALEASLRSQGN